MNVFFPRLQLPLVPPGSTTNRYILKQERMALLCGHCYQVSAPRFFRFQFCWASRMNLLAECGAKVDAVGATGTYRCLPDEGGGARADDVSWADSLRSLPATGCCDCDAIRPTAGAMIMRSRRKAATAFRDCSAPAARGRAVFAAGSLNSGACPNTARGA